MVSHRLSFTTERYWPVMLHSDRLAFVSARYLSLFIVPVAHNLCGPKDGSIGDRRLFTLHETKNQRVRLICFYG